MSHMSYIQLLERYHDHQKAIGDLLTSILTGIADNDSLGDTDALQAAVSAVVDRYPFVDMVYALDAEGRQITDNAVNPRKESHRGGQGADRSQRPYYRKVVASGDLVVTEPYLSSTGRHMCLSAALPRRDDAGTVRGYLVVDADLAEIVAFLLGDRTRRRFQPFFKTVYGLIVVGLLAVVAVLLTFSAQELRDLLPGGETGDTAKHLKPFGVIIFLTLSLAIFDLAKTILEEEVLTHKDIFRHSSTRRTITRFIAAILIAVSIESLLLMFKAALGDGSGLLPAVGMMLTVVGLLIALGIYVYLGSRAEVHLLAWHQQSKADPGGPGSGENGRA